jgi:biopolymer transport protein ExbD
MAGSVSSDDGDFGFQIAPMIDVVFVLMLFFMAITGQQIKEKELGIKLPSGRSSAASNELPKTPIIIEISADGQVSLNSKSYGSPTDKQLAGLRDWLKNTIRQFGDKDPVIIRPAPDAVQQRIMDVLNAAAASGVKNLTFG